MFRLEGGRPNDHRGFLHKSFIGRAVGKAVTTFVPGASTVVDVVKTGRSLFRGGGRSRSPAARPTVPRTTTARVTEFSVGEKELGKFLKFPEFTAPQTGRGGFRPGRRGFAPPQRAPCDFPMVRDSEGRCRTPTSGEFGGEQFGVGAAVMGRYGAALEPGEKIITRSVCLAGMQLGDDGLCYNRGAITNKQRMWPRGTQPLLTGGERRAISIAARAGAKLDRTTKKLRALGMMKALPAPRKPRAHAHAKPVAAVSV